MQKRLVRVIICSHYRANTVVRPSYCHNGNLYADKTWYGNGLHASVFKHQ